jgi:hypothetical protein
MSDKGVLKRSAIVVYNVFLRTSGCGRLRSAGPIRAS